MERDIIEFQIRARERSFIIKKTIRYAYGPKKLSEMVRKKPPMI